ncbi:MAG: ATP synthase F1 subunit gamma [Candidatus Doudnabacteria bacterium RIFCSPHIGHO2_01_FULL_45_18]|uniref:ATP synthase gamma chain n=1 Tax=Candidatus Doudnabacteria bacterium RIFCSPHIGHO2_01_FULL_45_18 TaxID=1817823 RepID=A0A1F5NRX4_9BACT|nr:MAG: ATP synthase F1 subunit gamma [Candidatus Doudnabacteria bacterium RIFCSPHIGHO2_01_FULL_45_18]
MASNTREIKRRIKSVTNIGQITKAMELVSAAEMRKAQAAATASRPYATLSSELIRSLAQKADLSSQPLINRVLPDGGKLPVQKVLVILISSDKGLAGAFNTNVISKAVSVVRAEGAEKIDFITVGKKGTDAAHRLKYNIVATFPGKDKNFALTDAQPIAQIAMQDYLAFKYEKVFIVYTDFVSTLVQRPNMLQLLPFIHSQDSISNDEFLFEPSPDAVLDILISHTIQFAIYQTLVEASASEHSARMVAMRNANEAAGDLISELSLSYNQARQAGITRELSEISAAKLAMEG